MREIAGIIEHFFSGSITSMEKLSGGTNNHVFLITCNGNKYIVKSFKKSNDSFERMKREVNFLDLCAKFRINLVPLKIIADYNSEFICETYIDGASISSTAEGLTATMNFLSEVNTSIPVSECEIYAKDSAFSAIDLLIDIECRLDFIESTYGKFFKSKIEFQKLFSLIMSTENMGRDIQSFFDEYMKVIISPSDIGPENILFSNNYSFIDFEYSGLDSNIKAGLDLLTRPSNNFDLLISMKLSDHFYSTLGFRIDKIPENLLIIFHFKWILIQISGLFKTNSEVPPIDSDPRLLLYLNKTRELIRNFERI
jgi:thiamine kinase-like enzyme